MDSTVLLHTVNPATALDDDMQAQWLPVYQADQPQWTYRRVVKVSSFRSLARIPSWCRKPQSFTYHTCAEDLTKTILVPSLSLRRRPPSLGGGGSYYIYIYPSRVVGEGPILCDVSGQERVSKTTSVLPIQQLVSHRLHIPDSLRQNLPMSCSNS